MPRRASGRPVGCGEATALSSFRPCGMRSGATCDRKPTVHITGWTAPKFSSLERNLNLAEYKNPQQEPGGDRRMLMVFAVTFALIIISQIFLFKDKGKQQPKPSPVETSQSSTPASPPQSEVAAAPTEAVSKGRAHRGAKPVCDLCGCKVCQQRSPNRRRERLSSHRVYQPRCSGEVVGAEEIQGRRRTSA